ncbi:MAG TPA: lanthionine synthetase LanC family protein [Solirubrobacteraceae bacterium]|nr:lanthionine synthetase LanC family protein [Solirubrobacteraceae bacterium]
MRIRSIAPPAAGGGTDVLAAADAIGERLVREAVWYRGQCNWIGVDAAGGDGVWAHRALGPSLGDGTAGIALFLAQLHAATGAEAAGQTARGAIAQAVAHADTAAGGGMYAGAPGIAYGAACCGRLLGDERLVAHARRLAAARAPRRTAAAAGLATGTAGAIVALLALARLLGDERLVDRAGWLGNELVAAARQGPDGWCWPSAAGRHGLCGMSDGAAGAASALLELFAATGDDRHHIAIERALMYERAWFDAEHANWPDLRGIERREPRGAFQPPYATTWSHGAPGIALSRLRGWQITGDERSRRDTVTALATTAAAVERELLAPRPDFTLGHGLAGNADVLLLGAELLPEGPALAHRVGDVGVGRYATSLDGWPCGGGRTPALLTGDAGIGLFLLRLRDLAVPSVLLPGAPPP